MINIQFDKKEFASSIDKIVRSALVDHLQNNPPPVIQDKVLTSKEAADFLNVSISTIYIYTQNLQIPFYKRGKRLYFIEKDLIDWIKAGRVKTVKEIEFESDIDLSVYRRKVGKVR